MGDQPESNSAVRLSYIPPRLERGDGHTDPRTIILAIFLPLLIAPVVAVVIVLWRLSPVPTFLFMPTLLQGMLIGAFSVRFFRRLQLRNVLVAIGATVFASIFSVALVRYGMYVGEVLRFRSALQDYTSNNFDEKAKAFQRVLLQFEGHPFQLYDAIVLTPFGYSVGFRGHLEERLADDSSGPTAIWWALDAVCVAVIAALMSRSTTNHPFCKDCNRWFAEPVPITIIHGNFLEPLTKAIEMNDAPQVQRIIRSSQQTVAESRAMVQQFECPQCHQSKLETVLVTYGGGSHSESNRSSRFVASPEMVSALRTPGPPLAKVVMTMGRRWG